MLKTKLLLLTVIILSVLTGCGLKVGGVDIGKAFESTSNAFRSDTMNGEERTNFGLDMTAIILGAAEIHPNEELQQYVNQVGSWVAMHANLMVDDEEFTDWQFIVVSTNDFNAFAMPGGFVVISSGALEMLSSEAELAAILAHEIVHIEQDHHVNAIVSYQRTEGITNLAFLANDARKARKKEIDRDYIKTRVVSSEVADIAHKLYLDGISREDELDADSKAVVLLARAGYEPYAYLSVLQMLASLEDDRKVILSSTHPDIDDRLTVAHENILAIESYLSQTQSGGNRFTAMME